MSPEFKQSRDDQFPQLIAPQIMEIPSIDEFRNLLSPQRVEEWKKAGIDVDTPDGLEEAYRWLVIVYKNFRDVRSHI
ncbi:hypothetical protein [Acaryochloris sp. IP29b_bin.137]|uniref:hypothetical protein n=1 Tax=Acaryochloris sp. IP29b_bin.137 TaxID=2969217 RepID=UPI00263648BB|nr:hypothetical protein [Acaryochloris sp. IP29b_bin.137]